VANPYDLLVLAELNPDVVVACDEPPRFGQVEQLVERATLTLGSSGAITAAAAAALGLRVGLCGVVGDDDLGSTTVELLRQTGVDVDPVVRRPGMRTGMTVVLTRSDGDRALLTFPGTMAELRGADVPVDALATARHVHVSSFYLQTALQPDLAQLCEQVRERGATTSIDPGWDPAEKWASIGPVLPQVSVLLPNAAECQAIAASLGDSGSLLDSAKTLHSLGPAIVLKQGAEGASIVDSDGVTSLAGRPVVPVDTTGAGDNFDAGYLSALLEGRDRHAALARGIACGAVSVSGWGGTGALATRHQANELADKLAQVPAPDTVEERR
jgi:ribokinase